MENQKRIKAFDLMRVVAFALIILYHLLVQLQIEGIYPAETVSKFYATPNMHIATLAVSIFFMLSGASLYCSTKEGMSIKKFYKKRLLRLLIPFYIVVFVYDIFRIVISGSISAVFNPAVPKWRIILTLLGLDEWISMHGIVTFSCGVGEWFLGLLIVIYCLFPLIKILVDKYPKLFFVIVSSIYIIFIYNDHLTIPIHQSFIPKCFEFILGIYIYKYLKNIKEKSYWLITVPLFVFFATSGTVLNINNGLKITIVAITFFISFTYIEDVLSDKLMKVIGVIASYTYEVYLVHHIYIYRLTPVLAPYIINKYRVIALFILEIICMIVSAIILKAITKIVYKLKVINSP